MWNKNNNFNELNKENNDIISIASKQYIDR